MTPVVVLPVARFDWNLAVKWLDWVKLLSDRGTPLDRHFDLVVLCSPAITMEERHKLYGFARVVVAENIKEVGYFGTPNQTFKAAIEYTEKHFPGCPMLWCEADTVPMRPSWVMEIANEYDACGKPVLADYIDDGDLPHISGNAVYPPNWRELFPSFSALPGPNPAMGWDSQCAPETKPLCARSRTIRQVWRPIPFTASNWRNIVPEGTALFHQDKSGKLIDILCAEMGLPAIPLEPALCESDYPVASLLAVPPYGITNVEILYVTCAKDIPFLQYSLQGVQKFAKGFRGVTVAVPQKQAKEFEWVPSYGAKLWFFDEVEGKGFMHHELIICRADEVCPQAQAILHIDSDVMPWAEFTPQSYMVNSKPVLYRETYEQAERNNPNRLLWRKPVTDALGFVPPYECMIRHPAIHLREVYGFTRKIVEAHTGMPFDKYVLSCKNDWPMGFCEFVTLGNVAIQYFAGAYHFIDYDRERDARECGIPHLQHQYIYRKGRDFMAETWSHGGIAMYESWLRQWLDGRPGAYWTK